MELYYHKTDGGAEYYQTDPTDIRTTVLRTDGEELEIMSLEIIFSCSEALSGHQGNTWEFSHSITHLFIPLFSTTISLSLYLSFIFT